MALFQGVELRVSSGELGSTMMAIERLQTVNVPIDLPRADVRALNRLRPEVNRPIVNYTPVPISFEYIKSDNIVEKALGLTTGAGVICGLVNAKTLNGYGMRNFEILHAPPESLNYNGQFNIGSGVLNSYSVSASVGDFAKVSMSFEGFDIGWNPNNDLRTGVNYNTAPMRGRDVSISGVEFSGYGFSGLNIQSFNLGVNINRSEVTQIGSKFPVDRPIVDAFATIQVQAFFQGGHGGLTGLGVYDCGGPTNGSFYFTLVPSCGGGAYTTYRAVNPYIQSINQGYSVGNFAAVDMTFSIPLPISTLESGGASNLIIS